MNKVNLILIGVVLFLVGAGSGYAMNMSGDHDEAYLKETAEMMKDDSTMMKEMYEMASMSGKMMQEKGTQYNDSDLTAKGKTAVEKSAKLDEMSKEMMTRGEKLMKMME